MLINKYRSVKLSYFYSLCKIPGLKICLQKYKGREQLKNLPEDIEIINLGENFNDFSDTAAAIKNLDLVITIDTSIVHLAGALNKPAWLLLSTYPDWRWFLNKDYSPWYKSLKIIRQKKIYDWQEVFERVFIMLNEYSG